MVLVDYASSDDEGAGPSSSGISNLAITPSTKVIAAPDVSLEVEYSNLLPKFKQHQLIPP